MDLRKLWITIAIADLRAMHDLLKANHPGPVDQDNTQFNIWLKDGLCESEASAQTASSFEDYKRTLLLYKNIFQDNHIDVQFTVRSTELLWTGFLVTATSDKDAIVTLAEPDVGVTTGDRLLRCDGRAIEDALDEQTDRYFWNAAVPHHRYLWINLLFQRATTDTKGRLKSCIFDSGAIDLDWRRIGPAQLQRRIEVATPEPQFGLREIGGISVIGIPTFDFRSKPEIERIEGLIAQICRNVEKLRQSTVLIDVRGNAGGNSTWGEKIAKALWGQPLADYIIGQFDWTADWRVSAANLEKLNQTIELGEAIGDNVSTMVALREKMLAGLKYDAMLVRDEQPSHTPRSLPQMSFTNRIYLLTDPACGSASLDFIDIVRRMPNVIHVGLPTNADSVYMDTNRVLLPSGLASLGYGMKVYRNRVRKNNEWYEPHIRWNGGAMSDIRKIVRWVKSLH